MKKPMPNDSLVPQAVCILLLRQTLEGVRVLCASRKNDLENFGLPGGKVDFPESLNHAAVREFREETDINIYDAAGYQLNPVYTGMCGDEPGTRGYMCTTYLYTGDVKLPSKFSGMTGLDHLEGYQPKGEGVLSWLSPSHLAIKGAFYQYNRMLFSHMGLLPVF